MNHTQKIRIVGFCLVSTCLFASLANVAYCNSSKTTLKKIENSVSKEKIKSKFHETADLLTEEKVQESIDQVADYLDKDKLKEKVDEIADYFDKDKIKEWVDFIAENINKDKMKDIIDLLADTLDREKIKDAVHQIAASIHVNKEQIKETFDESVDHAASSLQDMTHQLEAEIKHLGSNKKAIQDTILKYNYHQWVSDEASYGPATLSHLKLGGSKQPVVIARPGETIEGEVDCSFNRKQCSALSLYRVVLGIKDKEGQTTIFNHFGLRAGKETDRFTLKAPQEQGVYQVGFRVVEATREGTALQSWNEPNEYNEVEPAIIGLIIVS